MSLSIKPEHPELDLQVVVGVIINAAKQVLIAQRQQPRHLAGLWEFPGGKIELMEPPLFALTRELKEELDIEVHHALPLMQLTHHYPEKSVHLNIWRVVEFSGIAKGNEGQPIRWANKNELRTLEFPAANIAIIQKLEELLS